MSAKPGPIERLLHESALRAIVARVALMHPEYSYSRRP